MRILTYTGTPPVNLTCEGNPQQILEIIKAQMEILKTLSNPVIIIQAGSKITDVTPAAKAIRETE